MPRLITFILLCCVAQSASAQSPLREGNNEFGLLGKFDYQGPNGDNIDLVIEYGWFLRDDMLVQARYQWALSEDIAPGNKDYRAQQASAVLQYWFDYGSQLVPYVGVEAGLRKAIFSSVEKSGLVLGIGGGVRYFLTDAVSLDASIRYLVADEKVFIVDFVAKKNYVVPAIGLRVIF